MNWNRIGTGTFLAGTIKVSIFVSMLLPFAYGLETFADYREIPVPKGGTLEGMVVLTEETPSPAMIANRNDPQCPRGIAQNHFFVRQENLGLRNAVVILEVPEGKPPAAVKKELRMEGCVLRPRLQWSPPATSLLLRNVDSATHKLRVTRQGLPVFAVEVPPKTASVRRPLVQQGWMHIACDRHPWELAWIIVSENPYITFTDEKGSFKLSDIPSGRYTLRVWHEGWQEKNKDRTKPREFQPMEQTVSVSISSRKTTRVKIDDLQPTFSIQ